MREYVESIGIAILIALFLRTEKDFIKRIVAIGGDTVEMRCNTPLEKRDSTTWDTETRGTDIRLKSR